MTNRMSQFFSSEQQDSLVDLKIETVNLDYIAPNKLNTMPMTNIDDLKASISSHGLQEKIIVRPVRQEEYAELKKMYVVISGHRRLQALKELNQENGEFRTIDVFVDNRIETELEELVAIALGNAQREEDTEVRYAKTIEWGYIFDEMYQQGLIEKNTAVAKSDWIGQRMNRSGRTIRRYWEEMDLKNAGTEEKTEEEKVQPKEVKEKNPYEEYSKKIRSFEKMIVSEKALDLIANDHEEVIVSDLKSLLSNIQTLISVAKK